MHRLMSKAAIGAPATSAITYLIREIRAATGWQPGRPAEGVARLHDWLRRGRVPGPTSDAVGGA